ncbi:hypothetical protein Tco_0539369 [Tanacetum coccineum]
MANLPPNHNEFALAAEAAPNNMNGWIEEEEDPEMEEEEDPEEDPEMEEEEEEMDVDADEEWDGPEWMLPYQGADPLNPPPPASDSESEIEFEEAEVVVAPIPPPPVPVDHYIKSHHMLYLRLYWAQLFMMILGDPYVAARDAATAPATDNDDPAAHEETSPSEPQGSPPRDS